MKKIVIPTGYMGSGSSAVTALVSEFRGFECKEKSFEYVFLHCPNGLFDLEDKLLIGNNALRSDEALKSFSLQMNKLYSKKFWWVGNYQKIIGSNFKKYTDEFLSNITQYKFRSYWYMHEELDLIMFFKLLVTKPLRMLFKKSNIKILKYKNGMEISFIKPQEFYKYSKEYINSIVNSIDKKNNVVLDQFLLPFNLHRIDNYFDNNVKVIVVERDPRDIFITNKYKWKKSNEEVPFPTDATNFCDFYINMRNSEKIIKSEKILRIKFEDMIYQYDNTLKTIAKFLQVPLKDHIKKKNNFNPSISIKNTQVFRKEDFKEEIKIIEEKLKLYLYEFPYRLDNDVNATSTSSELDDWSEKNEKFEN